MGGTLGSERTATAPPAVLMTSNTRPRCPPGGPWWDTVESKNDSPPHVMARAAGSPRRMDQSPPTIRHRVLLAENRILRGQLTGRGRLTDDERRRLAAQGRRLGRRHLRQVATIVTRDPILRWHRQGMAGQWTLPSPRPGRPGIVKAISSLMVRMAREHPGWGYPRIQRPLRNLGRSVARRTVAKVLKVNGIPRAPDRPSSWQTFLQAPGAGWGG